MQNYCMYLRKSRADMDAEARGEGETLARHQAMLTELARRQELNVTAIYKEIVSGDSIAARPQMQQLLADISENRYAGVLVVEIERLARGDTIDQGIVAQAFKQSGTKIITPLKTYDPENEFDEEYFEFSLFMSRREYKAIKRRMQAGRLASVKEGNYICSTAPYGYKKVNPEPKSHTIAVVPEEAEIVKLIYKLYLDGHGAKYIAAELNRMGIVPRKSELWEAPSVKKILSNPVYCGKLGWKTKSNGDTLYDGKHEPIISVETFQAAQSKKQTNPAAQLHPNDTLMNYYHGILYCKNCGHQMKRRIIAARGYEHALCVYRTCQGKVVASSFSAIDEVLLSSIRYRIEALDKIISGGYSEQPDDPGPDKRLPLESELAKARRQLSRLYDLLEQEVYDTNTFLDRSKLVTNKINALETSLAELASEEQIAKLPPEESRMRLQYVIDHFDGADAQERSAMLRAAIRKIYYTKSQRMCRATQKSDLSLEIDFM